MALSLSSCAEKNETDDNNDTVLMVTGESEEASTETKAETTTETEAETTTEETATEPEEEIVPFKCEYTYSSNGVATITDYLGDETDVVVPETIDGYTVTAIGDGAFRNEKEITSIVLPDTVTSIGYNAFSDCKSLKELSIPSSVNSIGSRAFHNTPWYSLHKDGYFVIADNCLIAYTGNEAEVTVPEEVRLICTSAFRNDACDNIVTVTLPKSVTVIDDNAFSLCHSLESINLPDSITSIGNSAFRNTRLTSIRLPENLKNIGDDAFQISNL
ncbi:MAG: leucine-rich repeat domain-containing protein [Oscillospiraceae bacterium]|nr:leucine-rich repeat domain-containing protein [Oscillospiraceae bacterium]